MMSNTTQGEAFKDNAAEQVLRSGDYDKETARVDADSSSTVFPRTAALPAVSVSRASTSAAEPEEPEGMPDGIFQEIVSLLLPSHRQDDPKTCFCEFCCR